MRRISLVSVLVSLVLAGYPAYSHHSAAGTYLLDQKITIKGSVAQLLYRNPHSFLKIDVKDESGQVIRWSAEWNSTAQLANEQVTRDSLKPGDQIELTGNPGRTAADHTVRILKVVRPADGWKWEGVYK